MEINRNTTSKKLPVPRNDNEGIYREDGVFIPKYRRKALTAVQRAVIRKIAMGMPKGKAWISEHPNCKYMANAYTCLKNLFQRRDAVEYYNEIVDEQNNYIDENNMISLDGISLILKESIAEAQAMIDMGKQIGGKEGMDMVARGIQLKSKIAVDYSKTIGRGRYKEKKEEKKLDNTHIDEENEIINVTPMESKLDELISGKN